MCNHNITINYYSFLITSAGFCKTAFHTRQPIHSKIKNPIIPNIATYIHTSIGVCLTYRSIHCFIKTYPTGKAIITAVASNNKYSRKNRWRIWYTCAPLTLRMAISLRRCSQDNVTNENIPNKEIRIQTNDTKVNSFIKALSERRYLSYSSSSLNNRKYAFGSYEKSVIYWKWA